ncbi:PIN domain-containing protein [Devosia psychrophila]|uniref:PIN domain-containing protein n=1 Tax=Devosia psychrophila TaxID=728005 RepID=UPI00130D5057|nr:PIN domain-containing protein [Devosia psychrophila]
MSAFVLGVDTNVLVRFLTRDDETQAEHALRIITTPQNQPIRVSLVVLVELVWVLTKVKRWPSKDVFEACRGLLRSSDFFVEQGETVEECLSDAQLAGCDLADALIGVMNARAGCTTTVTFDREAQKLSYMTAAESFA